MLRQLEENFSKNLDTEKDMCYYMPVNKPTKQVGNIGEVIMAKLITLFCYDGRM